MRWLPHHTHYLVLGCVVLFVGLSLTQYFNLVTADLGRHLINGREVWQHPELLSTNFYSYTHQSFAFVNHHWLYGVMVYSLSQLFGLSSLTLFNATLGATSLALLLWGAYKKHGFWPSVIAGILAIPPVTSRVEVRPELLSMLGLAVYIFVLEKYTNNTLSFAKTALILLATQVIWQNSHLFFVFGLVVLFLFWVDQVLQKNNTKIKQLLLLGVISGCAVLLNPNGVQGALQPLRIFENYGYKVAENQTLWFMITRFATAEHVYTAVLLFGTLLLCLPLFIKLKKVHKRDYFLPVALFVVFGLLAQQVIRTRSFFGLTSVYTLSALLPLAYSLVAARFEKMKQQQGWYFVFSPVAFVLAVIIFSSGLFRPVSAMSGFGPLPGADTAARFIKEHSLTGPIFNNYDIGGYLIYYLYPQEEVFVDNRPEAYPTDFFAHDYIAPQENSEDWERLQQRYNFNLIAFNRHDLTPWGQSFLIARIQDPNWTPVFVDAQVIIFLRNTTENEVLTKQLALPKEMFSVVPTKPTKP